MAEVAAFKVPPVVKRLTIALPQRAAFERFTDGLASWWPLHSHSRSGQAQSCAFEPRLGGRLYERTDGGEELVWGLVEVWEPHSRLGFTWRLGLSAEEAQHVEVTFTPAGESATEVVLTHFGWEALGERASAMRERYQNGWEAVFVQRYGALGA